MRHLIGFSVAATAMMAAAPAHAAEGAFLLPQTLSLASTSIAAPASSPADTDFRLHALIDTTPAPATSDSETSKLRRGFGGAMMSFFPSGGDGFNISAGGRFYSRGIARPSIEPVYSRLLYAPRAVLARASRRMTPAITMGYSRIVREGLSLGIEGGAMLGKFDSLAGALVRPPRLRGEGFGDGAGRLNQVARMTLGYHF